MRGYLYNICDDPEGANSETDTYEFDRLIGREFDWYDKIGNADSYIADFLTCFKNFGFEIIGNNCFRVTPDGKQNYFREQYKNFIKLANETTLEMFSDNIYDLNNSLEETYSEAVYYNYFHTLDDFVRKSEVEKVYYITEVYRMH